MIKMTAILKREEGSVIIAALLVLVLLTIVGISATTTSNTELHVSTNGQLHKMAFFVAEGGWQVMTAWLDHQYPLPTIDLGSEWPPTNPPMSFVTRETPDLNEDGLIDAQEENAVYDWVPFSINDANHRFRTSAAYGGASIAPGWDPTLFLRFNYAVTSTGSITAMVRPAESQITVTVGKIQER